MHGKQNVKLNPLNSEMCLLYLARIHRVAQKSLDITSSTLIEIYWQGIYTYWILKMFEVSFFSSDVFS